MIALAALVVVAFATGSASARESRKIEASFGSGELALSATSGVGVNEATHDVFVADSGHGDVVEFEANGTRVATFGSIATPTFLAVDNSGGASEGDIYVVSGGENKVLRFTASGSLDLSWGTSGELGGFGEIAGIAVGQSGTLYVLEENSTVHEFDPAGVEQSQFEAPRGTSIAGLAVDSEGNLYKVDGSPEVTKFDGSGGTLSENLTGREDASGLGVDAADDGLYVLNGNSGAPFISEFQVGCGERCKAKAEFGETELTGTLSGIAIDAGSEKAYVAETGQDQIVAFGPLVVLPDVTALPATGVKVRSATLTGTVNPSGLAVSECKFEYFASGAPPISAPCEGAIPPDEADHAVEATVASLEPGTTYTVRLVARNVNGPSTSSTIQFTTVAPATTEPATQITGSGANLNGLVVPGGEAVNECFFEYGPTEALGSTKPCVGETPPDESPHPVSAAIGGLHRATYFDRLVIVQPAGVERGSIVSFETAGAMPREERALSVGVSESDLFAEINPRGASTSYFFEYGPAGGPDQRTPVRAIGSKAGFLPVAAELSGLAAGTTYSWRLVLLDEFGEAPGIDHNFTTLASEAPEIGCGNQLFRTGAGAALPDCRAYEQATPIEKHGSNALGGVNYTAASASGDRVTFSNAAGLPTTGGSSSRPVYLASRNAEGWTSNGTLPYSEFLRWETLGWGEEISQVASVSASGLALGDTAAGAFQTVVKSPPNVEFSAGLDGVAEDPEQFTFQAEPALAEGAVSIPKRTNLYSMDHSKLSLVARIPKASATKCDDSRPSEECIPAAEGSFAGPYDWANQESSVAPDTGGNAGTAAGFMNYYTQSTISGNGSRIFFTAAGTGQLYEREDGTRTFQISASQRMPVDPHGSRPAVFLEATPDGSMVFFLSCEKLTDDSTAFSTEADSCLERKGGQPIQGQDLYAYDTDTHEVSDLSVDSHSNPHGAEVVGFLGASSNGSYAYFVANGVLTEGKGVSGEEPSPGDCRERGQEGSCNLYMYHDHALTFIARLDASSDHFDWAPGIKTTETAVGKESRVAPGGTLLFGAVESLTGYDNKSATVENCEPNVGPLCREFYLLQPTDPPTLRCVTCSPTNAAPDGSASLAGAPFALQGRPLTPPVTRNLSADGTRVFFETPDRLVAGDTNGVEDAYEWEEQGTGTCQSAKAAGGCLYLLSSGKDPSPSYFGDASRSGNDAFILTAQSLVGADRDQLYDVYDARVEGGLTSQQAGGEVEPCGGEGACRGGASSVPNGPAAGTSTFVGGGNPPRQKCAKGKKGKKGKKQQKKCKKGSHKKSKKRQTKSGKKGKKQEPGRNGNRTARSSNGKNGGSK